MSEGLVQLSLIELLHPLVEELNLQLREVLLVQAGGVLSHHLVLHERKDPCPLSSLPIEY